MFTLNSQLSTLNLILLLLPAPMVRADGVPSVAKPELRAFWADGFNEGYKTPQQIDTLLQRLHDAHCNAVFAQMRKGGDAYYASHYEPWATDDTQHFDALACLIDKAHRMQPRIAVHAWINTCAVGTGTKHPGFHIAQLHPEWMSVNARGQADDGEVRKIDPGCPDAADWTFRLYLDVVRHYDVDGIHFDFVRYGSPRWGYNPVSVQRFRAGSAIHSKIHSNAALLSKRSTAPAQPAFSQPDEVSPEPAKGAALQNALLPAYNNPAWKQWRRDQVTALVRKVYAHAVAIKPQIVVSAATIAWGNGPHNEMEWQQKSAAMNRVFQDWRSWLREGILDLSCPMTYFGGRHGLEYERTWSNWIKAHQYDRAATIAVGNWQLLPEQTLAQMRIARAPDARGHTPYGVMLYSYAGTNLGAKPGKRGLHELELQPDFYALLSHPSAYSALPPFPSDVVPPSMPWKTQPTKGILKGFVRDPNLQPMDGARVVITAARSGRQWIRGTDGTGFYAFIGLPPDRYTVQAAAGNHTKVFDADAQQALVEPGKAATRSIFMDLSHSKKDNGASATASVETLDSVQAVIQRAQSSLSASALSGQTGVATGATGQTPRARLRTLAVVIGTDTFPGNLYVRDARDKAGLCLHVHLSRPPLIPFQPCDMIDVIGTPGIMDGEPGLNNANACLNDITLETEAAPVLLMPLRNLMQNASLGGGFARIRGVVTQSDADGFTLKAETEAEKTKDGAEPAQVRVPLSGRKDFGVEAGEWTALRPAVGSVMEVTGLATATAPLLNGTRQCRFLPRGSADITLIAPPSAPVPSRTSKTVAAWLALLLLALWAGRKHLRRLFARVRGKP